MGQGRGWVVLGGHAGVKATRVGLCAHIGPSRVANDAHKPHTWEHHPEIGAAVQGPAHMDFHTPPCRALLVVQSGVNLLWLVVRDKKGSVRYLITIFWLITRRWAPLWMCKSETVKCASNHFAIYTSPFAQT